MLYNKKIFSNTMLLTNMTISRSPTYEGILNKLWKKIYIGDSTSLYPFLGVHTTCLRRKVNLMDACAEARLRRTK